MKLLPTNLYQPRLSRMKSEPILKLLEKAPEKIPALRWPKALCWAACPHLHWPPLVSPALQLDWSVHHRTGQDHHPLLPPPCPGRRHGFDGRSRCFQIRGGPFRRALIGTSSYPSRKSWTSTSWVVFVRERLDTKKHHSWSRKFLFQSIFHGLC